jgi:hypothetical protein
MKVIDAQLSTCQSIDNSFIFPISARKGRWAVLSI